MPFITPQSVGGILRTRAPFLPMRQCDRTDKGNMGPCRINFPLASFLGQQRSSRGHGAKRPVHAVFLFASKPPAPGTSKSAKSSLAVTPRFYVDISSFTMNPRNYWSYIVPMSEVQHTACTQTHPGPRCREHTGVFRAYPEVPHAFAKPCPPLDACNAPCTLQNVYRTHGPREHVTGGVHLLHNQTLSVVFHRRAFSARGSRTVAIGQATH